MFITTTFATSSPMNKRGAIGNLFCGWQHYATTSVTYHFRTRRKRNCCRKDYLHHIRRVYDIHLKDFLVAWLPGGKFSTKLKKHLNISDVEVLSAIRKAYENEHSVQHTLARRLQCREHYRRFYEAAPSDVEGGKLQPGRAIALEAEKKFGAELIRYDYLQPKAAAPMVRRDTSSKGIVHFA